jgi:hypothetical protein
MHVYICIHTYMHVYVCKCACMHVCTYMHIYACIYSLPKSMHVYACICHICMYIASICMYIQLGPPTTLGLLPTLQITVPLDTIKQAQLRAPLGLWQVSFIRPRQHFCRPDFWHHPARHASWASAAPSWILREAPRAITELVESHGLSQEIWRTGLHPAAMACRQPPLQNTSRPRFDGACSSINLSIYACICRDLWRSWQSNSLRLWCRGFDPYWRRPRGVAVDLRVQNCLVD